MKKFKAILSIILCVITVSSVCIFPANATQAYPESEHKYKNNCRQEWEYTYPGEAEMIGVTFSEDTYVEPGDYYEIYFDDKNDLTMENIMEATSFYKVGDIISIFDSYGSLIGAYQGNELAGETVYIPGNYFKIVLTSDSTINKYGFKVTDVKAGVPEGCNVVFYNMPDGSVFTDICGDEFYEDSELYLLDPDFDRYISDGQAILGWKKGENGPSYYYSFGNVEGMEGIKLQTFCSLENEITKLYPITTPVCLNPDEVYSFENTPNHFDIDETDGYYFTKKDYIRMVSVPCVIGGVGPLAVPGAIMSWVVSTVPQWEWNGSCIGFSTTVCLQKKGILDVVSTQPGAKCMRDLEPTPELISLLNYYNTAATATIVSKNIAFKSQPEEFSRQLKKLYKSAEAGNIIDFQFHKGGNDEIYHGYAVVGAYTDSEGNHFILFYDENYSRDYAFQNICRKMWISPDFTEIHIGYKDGQIDEFLWNDSFEAYKSIDINQDYSRVHFHFDLIRQIFETLKEWISYYIFKVE